MSNTAADVTMPRLISIHPINSAQLAKVVEKMRDLGPPSIRVVDCGDCYFSIEGTHRIEAARLLSLPVFMDVLNGGDLIDVAGMDIEVNWQDAPGQAITAREVIEKLRGECNGEYLMDAAGMVTLIHAAAYPPIPPP